jgi:hypothetical protein
MIFDVVGGGWCSGICHVVFLPVFWSVVVVVVSCTNLFLSLLPPSYRPFFVIMVCVFGVLFLLLCTDLPDAFPAIPPIIPLAISPAVEWPNNVLAPAAIPYQD